MLQGCSALNPLQRETLHITVVPMEGTAGRADMEHSELAGPVLQAFRRLNPNVDLRIREQPETELGQALLLQKQRGLGPDLLLVRAPVAIALRRAGLIDAVPDNIAMRQALSSLETSSLQRVREGGGLAGLPVAKETTLACYDKSRVQQAPRTLKELMALAASGRPIGVAIEPIGIWWTAGPFSASQAMVPVVTGRPTSPPEDPAKARKDLVRWLQWLRQLALQNRVDIASGSDELVRGLANGRLAWIPCYSLSLPTLEKAMGKRLGVGVLPSGPDGPASAFSSERVWAFGTDSSPRQRLMAEKLARLSIDPMLQRQITLQSQATLPVNRYTDVPVSDSGRLTAMAEAQVQFRHIAQGLGVPFSAKHVQQVLPKIEAILFQAMVGVISPQQAATNLLELGKAE
jgi:hypothetical protein